MSAPTSVERLPELSERLGTEVWCKRDDLTSDVYGGNKVRKLEYLLGEAKRRRARALITTGGVGSHHVFATALYGRAQKMNTHAVLMSQPASAHVEQQLRAMLSVGAKLVPARGLADRTRRIAELALRLKLEGQRPFVIPAGGSNVLGTLGFVNAGLELAEQIETRQCPTPDAIYVPCGTCATVAGLALGLVAGGVETSIVAVRVTGRWMANRRRVAGLMRDAEEFLRHRDARFPVVAQRALSAVRFDHDEYGGGYGHSTPRAQFATERAAKEGLSLDPTYTAKAFASLVREADRDMHGKRLLFWNTLNSASMAPYRFDGRVPDALSGLMKR